MRLSFALALVLVTSCSGHKSDGTPAKHDQPIQFVPIDAGAATIPGPAVEPSGMHLDDVDVRRPAGSSPSVARERRPIDVTLRSTPPGAQVAVDGQSLGPTPAFWNGVSDGREHTFVFTLPRHALAQYRFVPVSSGVLHARLEPIAEEHDAGVAPPPEVVPAQPPSAVTPPPAPPTVVTPADAAVVTPPPASAPGSQVGPQP